MRAKSTASLRWAAALALSVTIAASSHAQTVNKAAPLSDVQAGTGLPHLPSRPQPQIAQKRKPMTPFERVIAPYVAQLKKQGGPAKPAGADRSSRDAATAVGGASVNFPGFVNVPYLTIDDGDSTTIFNSVSADFNNDGKTDVALIRFDGTIDVILNPGTFTNIANLTPVISPSGNSSLVISNVIVADMNGDGIPDLVGQEIRSNQIMVWIGKGDGTFGAPNSYLVTLNSGTTWLANNGGSIIVGDFNGDGALDVATLTTLYTYGPNQTSVSVITVKTFLNNGGGILVPVPEQDFTFNDLYWTSFGTAAAITSDGMNASGIAFLLDDEGGNVPANQGINVVTMASNGDGTFTAPVVPTAPLVHNYFIFVDNSFVATNLSTSVNASLSTTMKPPGTPGSGVPTTDIVFMTGDGAVYDAPYTSGNPTVANQLIGTNWELFAFGETSNPPVPSPSSPPTLLGRPLQNQSAISVADMNGDGSPDLVVYGWGATYVFPNSGKGTFTAAPTEIVGPTAGVQEPQPANYDGSSFNSLINVDEILGQVGYFQNLGAAASTQAGQFLAAPLTAGPNTKGNFESFGGNIDVTATADINGDGVLDIIGLDELSTLNGPSNIVVGIRNSAAAGNQSSSYTFTTAVSGDDLNATGNGLIFMEPIAISNSAGTSILLDTYLGLYIVTLGKDGTASAPVALNMGKNRIGPLNYADVGDVNGDGIPDIVVAYSGDAMWGLPVNHPSGYFTLLGNADGTFQPATFTALGSRLYLVKLINFSGAAGNLDLAAIDENLSTLTSLSVYVVPNKADGSGTFNVAKATQPVTNYIVSDIIAGDYNSDGKQDLTLTTAGKFDPIAFGIVPNTSGVLLLPGNGDYTFGSPTTVNSSPFPFPQWGSYADFNGDGAPDLALVELYDGYENGFLKPMAQVLPNLGNGSFGPPVVEMSSSMGVQLNNTAYTFTGNFTNSGGPDWLVSSGYGTEEFVNRGVDTLALTASSTNPGQGTPLTLTATVTQVVSAGVAATGSVLFTQNGTVLGAAEVSDGVATLTMATLPVGSNAITATYMGDPNHNQAAASITVTIAPVVPGFTLTASPATLTLTQGATGTVIVSLAANSTFSGVVQLSCTGAPAESSCTASPASMTFSAGQSGALSVVVETTPPNNTFQAKGTRPMPPWTGTLSSLSLAGLAFALWPRRRLLSKFFAGFAIAALAFGASGALIGCSSGGTTNQFAGTPAGTYTLTVTATSGTLSQTQAIALTITAVAAAK
jgi:hypothetical protein